MRRYNVERDYNITSAIYIDLTTSDGTEHVGVKAVMNGVTIDAPIDPTNRHYAAILEWVAEGNTIKDAD
jgi:hypothetical protein